MPLTENCNLSLKDPHRKLVFSACLRLIENNFLPSASFVWVWKSENPLAKNLKKRRRAGGVFSWKYFIHHFSAKSQ